MNQCFYDKSLHEKKGSLIFVFFKLKTTMKKLALLTFVAFAAVTFVSCDKAAKLLFKPFESPLNFDVAIAPVSNTTQQQTLGSTSVSYNLDAEVKKNTDNNFGADIIGSMYLNQVAITLNNANSSNNLSNFESISLQVSTGSSTPVVLGPFAVPAGATNMATFTVANSPNIKPFFSGSNVNFSLLGKARTATTITLQSRVSATIKFDK